MVNVKQGIHFRQGRKKLGKIQTANSCLYSNAVHKMHPNHLILIDINVHWPLTPHINWIMKHFFWTHSPTISDLEKCDLACCMISHVEAVKNLLERQFCYESVRWYYMAYLGFFIISRKYCLSNVWPQNIQGCAILHNKLFFSKGSKGFV